MLRALSESDLNGINFSASHCMASFCLSCLGGLFMSFYFVCRRFPKRDS
jgi:hypothetical protein